MKKHTKIIFSFLVSGAFLYSLIIKTNFQKIFLILSDVKLFYFFFALFIFLFCWVLNSKKWQILLAATGYTEKLKKLFELNLIASFYTSILPGGQITGEIIKGYKIARKNEKKNEIFFSIIADKLIGLVSFIIIGFLGILFTKTFLLEYRKILFFFGGLFFFSLLFLLVFVEGIAHKIKKIISKIEKNKHYPKIKQIISSVFIYQGKYKVLASTLSYGLIFQFFNTLGVYSLALALSINISFLDLLWINAAVNLVLIFPFTVMGIGLREFSLVHFFSLLKFSSYQAFSLSLLISLSVILTGFLGLLLEFKNNFKKQQ